MLRFVDPDSTTTFTHEGVTFTIGFWPPREAERISAGIAAMRKLPVDSEDARAISADVHYRMVEYGVRSWSGWGSHDEVKVEKETIHGREHARVPEKIVRSLYSSGAIWPVGLACFNWNSLSEQEKKKIRLAARLPREEPAHVCSRCLVDFPKEHDGHYPWKQDDGTWNYECPWVELEEAVETLQRYEDWRDGMHPVSTGRAPWLTGPFEDAMRFCRVVKNGG